MPEIPELEAIRGYLTEHVAGRPIADVDARIPPVFRTPMTEFRQTLPGDVFGPPLRHGKWLLLPLASGRILAINPMLTGRFQYVPAARSVAKKTCLILRFEGGDPELRYVDDRLMGKLYLLPAASLPLIPGWDANGPDLLDPALTPERWLAAVKKYRGAIKNILTNAEFVQGIGNAYSDEILWEAHINPYTTRTALSEDQLTSLYHAAHAVMQRSTPLVREAMTRNGVLDYEERRDFMSVHRLGGKPCPRCGAAISEITANQRITSFCRHCQPGGPAA